MRGPTVENPHFQIMRHPDGATSLNVGAGAIDWQKVLQFVGPILIALLQQFMNPPPKPGPAPTPPAP